eukprot:36146_1
MDCVRYHCRTNPFNFLTGLYATCLREIPGTFVYFIAYKGTIRGLKYATNTPQINEPCNWMILSGGAMAGLSFWGLFYPVDLIRSQLQTQEQFIATTNGNTIINNQQSKSVVRLMINRIKQYGFVSLYNGYLEDVSL